LSDKKMSKFITFLLGALLGLVIGGALVFFSLRRRAARGANSAGHTDSTA
jgi:tetrahydromethanopterin S-methyltransferase subunit D